MGATAAVVAVERRNQISFSTRATSPRSRSTTRQEIAQVLEKSNPAQRWVGDSKGCVRGVARRVDRAGAEAAGVRRGGFRKGR
eukprot:10680078-Lingulodinium_polyedra.AAC.1